MIKLGAKELRTSTAQKEQKKLVKRNPVYIIVDNVLDTYNVGAIFRLADAVAAEQVLLCGVTETPPNTRIKKASINTTEWVSWQYFLDTKSAMYHLRSTIKDIQVVAIEQSSKSIRYDLIAYTFPVALVVGNETTGISKETLALVDAIAEIPMWGVNKSLNVMVSLGIVLFHGLTKREFGL